jgi:hypothetical protein
MNAGPELPQFSSGPMAITPLVPQGDGGEVDPPPLELSPLNFHEERAQATEQFVSAAAAARNVARIRRLRTILENINGSYDRACDRGDFAGEFSEVWIRRQDHVFSAGLAIHGDDPFQTGRGMWLRIRSFLGQMARWFDMCPLSVCSHLFQDFTGSWERDYVEGVVETVIGLNILFYLVPDLFYMEMNEPRKTAIGERVHAAGYFLTPRDVLYLERTTEFEWACRSAGRLAFCLQNTKGDTLLHIAHRYVNKWGLNYKFFNPDIFMKELPPMKSCLFYAIAKTRDGIPLYEKGDYFDFFV